MGCQGGWLDKAFAFLTSNGAVTEKCFHYVSGQGAGTPACPSQCDDSSTEFKTFHCKEGSTQHHHEKDGYNGYVFNEGPIEVAFTVY